MTRNPGARSGRSLPASMNTFVKTTDECLNDIVDLPELSISYILTNRPFHYWRTDAYGTRDPSGGV